MSSDFQHIRRTPASLEELDEQAEALAREKGIATLERPQAAAHHPSRMIEDTFEEDPADQAPVDPIERAAEPESSPDASDNDLEPPRPRSVSERVRDTLDNTPTPREHVQYAKVALEKKYKRQLEESGRDRDMTLQALILTALDQYAPLQKAGIRPRKADLAIKDGRRARGSRTN